MDREKVIEGLEAMREFFGFGLPSQSPVFEAYQNILTDTISMLKKQEAKTGHWIEQEDYALDTYYDCSVCGESWSTVEGTPWENGMNYCPHCGAKMV